MLAKCSAKEDLLERRRVKLDGVDYTHMSIGEVFSGYMSQVHSSRDIEIDMVKQMHQKFEVHSFLYTHLSLLMPTPKSIAYDEYVVDLETNLVILATFLDNIYEKSGLIRCPQGSG